MDDFIPGGESLPLVDCAVSAVSIGYPLLKASSLSDTKSKIEVRHVQPSIAYQVRARLQIAIRWLLDRTSPPYSNLSVKRSPACSARGTQGHQVIAPARQLVPVTPDFG